jgi:hypothetical protein
VKGNRQKEKCDRKQDRAQLHESGSQGMNWYQLTNLHLSTFRDAEFSRRKTVIFLSH